ncbi:MAG: DUF2470 domain-containing protein [Actinomycetia bacterium]|nr:DUF2470 domain-containing protein [Actinomycetes bacterium]MCH9708839.1 DUF2470 domain-containing protein [Actinomycetes bacterium]
MPSPAPTGFPTAAERIRSTCARGAAATLAIEDCEGGDPTPTPVHQLLEDGSLAITVPVDGPASQTVSSATRFGLQAMVELTDYAPLPLREPVRSLVWIQGTLRDVPTDMVAGLLDVIAASDPNPALLQVNTALNRTAGDSEPQVRYTLKRLDIESVVVADATGAESVTPGALLSADPDPFCVMEAPWLQHLESHHRDVIERLASRLPRSLRRGRVRPLGLDRYGVQLRVEDEETDPHTDHDVRLPFAKPVYDATGLSQAIRVLMGCPFLNGLRARGA